MKLAALAVLILAVAAPPARAADTTVATVAKATEIDAYGARAVWSTYDPAINAFRLTVDNRGRIRTLPVAPSPTTFDIDLGPGPHGGTVAIYSRCPHGVFGTGQLDGRQGCDLYAYRFSTGRETKVAGANTKADEYAPAVWGRRMAFTRTSDAGGQFPLRRMYWRALSGAGPDHRLAGNPKDIGSGFPEQLDMRGRRVAFVWQYEWGADLCLSRAGGRGRLLVRMPGSGAETSDLTAQGPLVGRRVVHWAFSVGQDPPIFTELRQVDLRTLKERRATMRITAGPRQLDRSTTGFSQDGGVSWYVRAPDDHTFEIHRASGLAYEPAPPPSMSISLRSGT
jgi:hypothetical protein